MAHCVTVAMPMKLHNLVRAVRMYESDCYDVTMVSVMFRMLLYYSLLLTISDVCWVYSSSCGLWYDFSSAVLIPFVVTYKSVT